MTKKTETKKRYRVLARGVTYPTDVRALRRLQAGEKVPWEERKMVQAAPGDIIEDVHPIALQSLLSQELIVEVEGSG